MISEYLKLALLYLEICNHEYFIAWILLVRYCVLRASMKSLV